MKHEHHGGHGRDSTPSFNTNEQDDHRAGGRHSEHRRGGPRHGPDRDGHHPGGRHGGRHGRRVFDYGELRLLLLAMLAEEPRHGYELIKVIEERFGGSYSPSPGVVYPTLAWLEDMAYASVEAEQGNRKRYVVTSEGEAFLAANRAAADDLLSRGGSGGEGGRLPMPAPVMRAMENLKLSMRLRLREGALTAEATEAIAAALDEAAKAVERSR